jgi:hypothetical protein
MINDYMLLLMNFRGFMAQNKTRTRLVRRRGRTGGRGFCKAIVREKKEIDKKSSK